MQTTARIPLPRIMEKLNAYMDRRDYEGAGRLLTYWLSEARLSGDRQGELSLLNELIGHCRKSGLRKEAFTYIDDALSLLSALSLEDSPSGGTTYINAATALSAFGENEKALSLFEKALVIYEKDPAISPDLMSGLYNNMALAFQNLGQYPQAMDLYQKAMTLLEGLPGSAPEQAITCLNMADAIALSEGMQEAETRIQELLDHACELLQDPSIPRDGYYAFVCEKCAPGFAYHGWFAVAAELREEARIIYERT
ncbi:MAG: tetratricopeptide repeat protein [Blautia sp.]|nr:tetratricopeptide repeat protein [Blautia sp.]